MLQLRNLTASIDGTPLIREVSLSVQAGEVVCVTGPNGSGKTTLLRCVAGEHSADAGSVSIERGRRMAALAQQDDPGGDGPAMDLLWSAHGDLGTLRGRALSGDPDAIATFQECGGYEIEARIAARAADLGVQSLLDRPASRVSLGQRRKLALAGVLASNADLLVLDEPANYLDIAGIAAFEDLLGNAVRRGAGVLMVSHDRELVDRLADRTLHLDRGELVRVVGGYTAVLAHRERDRVARAHRAETLRRQISALELDARRRAGWATRTEKKKRGAGAGKPVIAKRAKKLMKRAKSVERRMEGRRQVLERDRPFVPKTIQLAFPEYPIPHRSVVAMEGLRIERGRRCVLEGLDLALETRDRIALVGANGVGKTTLLRALTGELQPDAGSVTRNPSVRWGLVPQGLEGFFEAETLLPNFLATGYDESEVRQFLGAALLRREKVLQRVDSLSVGERMRSAIVRLVLERSEFLVLDEPTAHLDLESVEVLEALLAAYRGGFLLVSHDRRLIENTCDRILVLEDGRLREP